MSHEIRTPLSGVLGFADLLEETRLGPEQREYAEVIQESGDALLGLINHILDLSKIEAEAADGPAGAGSARETQRPLSP